MLNVVLPQDIPVVPIELCLLKSKWLVVFIYRLPSQDREYFLQNLVYLLDNLSELKNCVIMGDFNCEPKSPKLAEFLKSNLLFNHMKFNTCFKSLNCSCIYLMLSNQNLVFSTPQPVILGSAIFII